jgi:hypothetical protein
MHVRIENRSANKLVFLFFDMRLDSKFTLKTIVYVQIVPET